MILKNKLVSGFFLLPLAAWVAVAIIQIRNFAGNGIGFYFPPLYFLMLACVTYNLHNLKKILRTAYKPLIYIFYCGMAAVLIIFVIFCALIVGYHAELPDSPDLIIVLGSQIIGYEPGTVLRHRLDTAAQTLNKYPGATCIVAGGLGTGEIITEAEAMRRYLTNNGVAESRIFEEGSSRNTFQNLIFSSELIEQYDLDGASIIILTSEYHIPRAMMLAERVFDGSQLYAVQSPTPFAFFSVGITREFFAFVKSFIFDR